MHLQVSDPFGHVLVARCLLIGQFDSITHRTEEGVTTGAEVGGATHYHLQTLHLQDGTSMHEKYKIDHRQ